MLPALLADGQDPQVAPLQTHLLCPLPGDYVPGQEWPTHSMLPLVPPGDLCGTGPQLAGSTMGQQQVVGSDPRDHRRGGGRGGVENRR